ncbi:MAG: PilT/PilU family type 4a pilus ATPase [Gemmatimonadetes bacterium]|nr:MAG: PilT/PilU family type 4a pilus ATPase [Gemmatimonadota bacterium]
MEKIIKAAVKRGASDLHIKAGDVFRARVNGELVPLTKERLTPDQTRAIALKLIASEDVRRRIDQLQDYDCSWGMPGVGRFRVNILRQRSSFMVVMRVIPFAIPSLESLGAPDSILPLANTDHGLVLVAGAGGSGKSSTIAGLIDQINRNYHRHIVTIESPIEFLHRDLKSSVTQREVGIDTESVVKGLQAALRQDPDVIVISDLPDPETLDTAITAAETGLLVISSVPTPDVVTTLERVIAMIPADERDIGRVRLAEVLRGVVAQQLLPRADGQGRAPAFEVLVGTDEVRDILKTGAPEALLAVMEADKDDQGMQSFQQEIAELLTEGVIDAKTAEAAGVTAVPKRRPRRKPRTQTKRSSS